MAINELYEVYGKQMVDLEILNSQIQQTKQAIVTEINKNQQSTPVEVKSE